MTLEEAKKLATGLIVYHTVNRNADGTAQRWKVTSVKIWKRTPSKVLIGLKHGMYSYDSASEYDIQFLTRNEPEPIVKAKKLPAKKHSSKVNKQQEYAKQQIDLAILRERATFDTLALWEAHQAIAGKVWYEHCTQWLELCAVRDTHNRQ